MSRGIAALSAALGTLVLVAIVVLVIIFTGWYNVAATEPHTSFTSWALNALQHSSVAARAGDLEVTLPSDPAALDHGFEHYHAMCVSCHGAPGVDRGELGQGMAPTPPELAEEAHEWTDAELFWITKHGIKLAGMPAFGPTHSDEEILGIAAFVRLLPEMTPEEYASRVETLAADTTAGGHTHDGGEAHQH